CLAGGLADKVLLFPQKTNNSFIAITPEKPLNLTAFTLCMRVATDLQGNTAGILFTYSMFIANEFHVWIDKDGIGLYFNGNNDVVHFNLHPPLFIFRTHLCFTWSSSTGLTAAWVNGQRRVYQIYGKGQTIRLGNIVVLGQQQMNKDWLDQWFVAQLSFVGEITDVNLWDEVLTAKEIKRLYAHTTAVKVPNVINWRTAEYDKQGIVEVMKDDFDF
ncbi:C-reactive protein-like, partial [Misgurnus anguillicaudatus]|uniref:C-reactive protein-like n=1 Tax=Misgurnus anguillicaudatus TaxID=75329 RepID=UPI003CCFAE43